MVIHHHFVLSAHNKLSYMWFIWAFIYFVLFISFYFLQQGLIQLYDFKQKHPEADIEPFLRKSSQFFQNYIERGLKKVEAERRLEGKASSNPASENGSNSGNMVFNDIWWPSCVLYYLGRSILRSVLNRNEQVIVKKSYGKNVLSVSAINVLQNVYKIDQAIEIHSCNHQYSY